MQTKESVDIYKIWLGLAAFVVIIAGIKAASSIVVLFLLSVFIATVSAPAIFLLEGYKVPRSFAFFIVLSFVIILLFGFGYILSSSVDSFLSNTSEYQARVLTSIEHIGGFLNNIGLEVSKESLKNMFDPSSLVNFTGVFLKSFTAILSNSFIIFLGVTFILLEMSHLSKQQGTFATFSKKINRYLAIKTVVSLITGVGVALGLAILDVEFALFLGLIAFLLNYIPSFGSIIAAIPAVLVALVGADAMSVVWVIALYLTVNVVMGNIIEPHYMGKSLGLSVVAVFFSLIFWGWVLGPVGMFLAVPLTMSIVVALEMFPATKPIAVLFSSIEKE
ncbi:MAG: AI-2E family transporter [Campylobacterales bacterium]|nr:AI-2E family transporter [Campylobacterales bacterium]